MCLPLLKMLRVKFESGKKGKHLGIGKKGKHLGIGKKGNHIGLPVHPRRWHLSSDLECLGWSDNKSPGQGQVY